MPGSRRTSRAAPSTQEGAIPAASAPAALLPGKLWVQTTEGEVKEVEGETTALLFRNESMRSDYNKGKGRAESKPVQLPKQVTPDMLKLLLEYCQFHRAAGRSDKERKLFDEKFIKLDTNRLCELTSAADSLELKQLVELTSKALAKMIEGKSPEEIRETFHLPDDLTEEEKLEPVKNWQDDRRIRLLNRLYAKKRKALAEQKAKLRQAQTSQAGHQEQLDGAEALLESQQAPMALPISTSAQDNRSVEELLTFIVGQEESIKSKSKSKKKKKSKRKGSDGADGFQTMTEEQACTTSAPHAPSFGQPAAVFGNRREDSDALEDAELANGDEDFMEEDDDDVDDSLDDMDAFVPGLHSSWHEAGGGALSSPLLGPLHLRVTTLTSLSQFRPKLPPATSSDPGSAHHSLEARRHQPGEAGSPLSYPARSNDGLQRPAAAARAQSSSSSLSGSEASDSSSHRSSPSLIHAVGGADGTPDDRQTAAASCTAQHSQDRLSHASLSHPSGGTGDASHPRISESSSDQPGPALVNAHSLHSNEGTTRKLYNGDAGAELGRHGLALAPLGAQDALRVASALEDFLRMLGLHEQLQVIPSRHLLGVCGSSLPADHEQSNDVHAPVEDDGPAFSSGRQLHVQRVLPSGRSVALSVS